MNRVIKSFILSLSMVASVFVLYANPLYLIDLKQKPSKTVLRNLQIPLIFNNQDIIITELPDNLMLSDKGVVSKQVSQDVEHDPLFLITSNNNQPIQFDFDAETIIYQTSDVVILKGQVPDSFLLMQNHLKAVKLEKTERRYSDYRTSYRQGRAPLVDPAVLNAINPDSIAYFMQTLQDFDTRFCLAPNRQVVAEWIRAQFLRFGYTNAELQTFNQNNTDQYNVTAELTGTVYPSEYIMIGGHHDSIISQGWDASLLEAPGCDDNASGTACALEIARVMKLMNYQPKSSIRFMTYAMEELGLHGSKYDAQVAVNEARNIRAMLNSDMITNQNSDDWIVSLKSYDGSEFLAQMAIQKVGEIQGLNYFNNPSNSAGSDSWSYWNKGYPAIFFAEFEFSPVYHSVFDVMANCNIPYGRKLVQLSASMAMEMSMIPSKPAGFVLRDVGTGGSLQASWNAIQDVSPVSYHLILKNLTGNQETEFTTSNTSFTFTGLVANTEYSVTLTAVVDNLNSISQTLTGTPAVLPNTVTNFELNALPTGIRLSWSANTELDISGYKIFRSIGTESTPTFYQTVQNVTEFIDTDINDYIWYRYMIKAVDTAGNESPSSLIYKGRKVSLNHGILVIDDTFNGSGTIALPTDQNVDDFYASILEGYTFEQYEITESSTMTLSDLAPYSTVIYHRNTSNISTPSPYNEVFRKYFDFGGKMLISAYKLSHVFHEVPGYPNDYEEGTFNHQYLKINASDLVSTARFKFAETFNQSFNSLDVDSTKAIPGFLYRLSQIESITPTSEAAEIYYYQSGGQTDEGADIMNNQCVGIMYNGYDYKVMSLTFPLYNIKEQQAKDFMRKIMQIFNEVNANENPIPIPTKNACLINNYPNPFNPSTTIAFYLSQTENVSIAIHNVKGQLIRIIKPGVLEKGHHTLSWNGLNQQNKPVASGVYSYSLICDGKTADIRKMLLLK